MGLTEPFGKEIADFLYAGHWEDREGNGKKMLKISRLITKPSWDDIYFIIEKIWDTKQLGILISIYYVLFVKTLPEDG